MPTEKSAKAARHNAYFEADFTIEGSENISVEQRNARSLEYIAFQLGRIRKELQKANARPRQ